MQYRTADTIANDSQLKPWFKIVNTGVTTVPLSELKIRYWLTAESAKPQTYYCDWAQIGCASVTGQVVKLTTARANADHYLEIGFTGTPRSLAPGANSGEIQGRVAKSDWTAYDETNDYSFDVTKTTIADWDRVTLYRNGTLIWGTEP
ncbi:MAG TPA: cellulose binding domain-containing protein [Herpetosiphonaceae bacterium]